MFDDRLKMLREEKGLNKKDAATALGMAYTTYLGYEKNEREPNSEILIRIAKYFGVDVDYLLGISPCKRKENYILVEELGLSEKSIDTLKLLNENGLSEAMNKMIENENFFTFMRFFHQYKSDFNDESSAIAAFNEFYSNITEYQRTMYSVDNVQDYEYLIYTNLHRCFERLVERLNFN